jgi:Na+/melibiose symporter-like transporter
MSESKKTDAASAQSGAVVKNNVSQGLALVYGIGMLTWTAFNQMNSNYWSYFLTDICGLEASVMGTVKSVSAIGAWIFIIVAAVVIEKVWLRHGQIRSWLAIAPAAAFVCLGLTWIDPPLPVAAKAIWMIVFYMVGQFCVNFFMISATSLVPTISRTEHDRTLLSQRKAQGNMLVKVVFAAASLPIILWLNSMFYGVSYGDAKAAGPAGFTINAIILGVIMVVMFFYLYKRIAGMDPTEEYCEARYQAKKAGKPIPEPENKNEEKVSIKEMLKGWITNIPALSSLVSEITRFVAQMVIQGMAMYYFLYVYNDTTMVAVMLTSVNIAGLIGTFVSEPLAQKAGVRPIYMSGIVIAFFGMLLGYLFGAADKWIFVGCMCIVFFGMNFMNGTMMGVQSNAIAYGQWRDGKAPKAFIMSTYQWCPQIANAVAGALMGAGLSSIGFTKGMEASPELAQGMINIICLVPAIVFAVGFVVFFFGYRLNSKKMAQIAQDLQDREASEAKA